MHKESHVDSYIKLASEITPVPSTAAEKLMLTANQLASEGKKQAGSLTDSQLCCLQWLFMCWWVCHEPFMCLQYQDIGLSESEIGTVFLVGGLVAQILSPSIGLLTDHAAVVFGQRARFGCIAGCVLVTTIGFLLSFWPLPGVPLLLQAVLCRVLIEIKWSAVAILDAITQRVMEDRYGEARSYGALAFAVTSIILGMLWDNFGPQATHCCILVTMLAVCSASVCVGSPPAQPSKHYGHAPSASWCTMIRSYSNHHTKVAFFVLASSLQAVLVMPRSLLFLYFREMKMSFTLCGLSVFSSISVELPMLYYSQALINRFGPTCLLTMSGIAAVLRMACYTFVSGGSLVLLIEPLHGVIFGLSKAPGMKMLQGMTPIALQASGQSFFSMVINVVASFGVLISSYIIASFGEIALYAGASLVSALTIGIFMVSTFMNSPRL